MKVMVVYNRYRHRVHGEEAVVDGTTRLLRGAGIQVTEFTRSSERLPGSPFATIAAGFAGIYNPISRAQLATRLRQERPDVVHAHNLYPWISPSALLAANHMGVPVVMTVHHYGLTCPVLTHFRAGAACNDCVSHGEWSCVRHNCRNSMLESSAYALRTFVARKKRWFLDLVSIFIALSDFAKEQLRNAGFPARKIVVRPNTVRLLPEANSIAPGDYIGYAGRMTYEKGVDLLCRAAEISGLPVHLAGDVSTWPQLTTRFSNKVVFRGVLERQAMERFCREARFLVVPSRWWEVCPIVVLEAMNTGCPVLASDVGGLPEMLDHGNAGLLFTPGNAEELAGKMTALWEDASLRKRLSRQARQRVEQKYSEHGYLADLLSIYQQAAAR
jgi:glycosyltransferase involved in cell wall biosynthesis